MHWQKRPRKPKHGSMSAELKFHMQNISPEAHNGLFSPHKSQKQFGILMFPGLASTLNLKCRQIMHTCRAENILTYCIIFYEIWALISAFWRSVTRLENDGRYAHRLDAVGCKLQIMSLSRQLTISSGQFCWRVVRSGIVSHEKSFDNKTRPSWSRIMK